MLFYVFEIQTNETGSANVFVFNDRNKAEQKYHEVLMYASGSKVRKHGAILMNEDSFIIKSEIYVHQDTDTDMI